MGFLQDLFGGGGDRGFDAAREAQERNRALLDAIKLPEYSQFVPDLYRNENIDYQLVNEDPVTRSLQLQALKKMAGLAETGLADEDRAAFSTAKDEANQLAKGNTDAAIQNAQSRGVAGSGMEFAMREMANQGAAERARKASMDQAAASSRQRALYNQMYGDALSQQRSQDYRANAGNTDIINRFNQLNTSNRNAVGQQNVDLRNKAFQHNEGLKDKNYQNQMSRATGHMNINNNVADIGMAEDDARKRRNQGIGGLIGTGIGAMTGGTAGAQIGRGIGSALF